MANHHRPGIANRRLPGCAEPSAYPRVRSTLSLLHQHGLDGSGERHLPYVLVAFFFFFLRESRLDYLRDTSYASTRTAARLVRAQDAVWTAESKSRSRRPLQGIVPWSRASVASAPLLETGTGTLLAVQAHPEGRALLGVDLCHRPSFVYVWASFLDRRSSIVASKVKPWATSPRRPRSSTGSCRQSCRVAHIYTYIYIYTLRLYTCLIPCSVDTLYVCNPDWRSFWPVRSTSCFSFLRLPSFRCSLGVFSNYRHLSGKSNPSGSVRVSQITASCFTAMELPTKFRMGNHEASQPSESRPVCQPAQRQQMANFSYPRTDFVHLCRREHPGGRGSLGSDSSAPPMVEDHGSDFSAGDDCQYHAKGFDLWDSFWHAKDQDSKKPEYIATFVPSAPQKWPSQGQHSLAQENPPTITPGLASSSENRRCLAPPSATVPSRERRPRTPKPLPKVSYSLFPPPDPHDKPLSALQRRPLVTQQPFPNPLPPVHPAYASGPRDRRAIIDSRAHAQPITVDPTVPPGPGRVTMSSTASSSNPIRLSHRSSQASSEQSHSASSSNTSSLLTTNQPLSTNRRGLALSRNATRSSPSLVQLAKLQDQAKRKGAADLHTQPLPRLPAARSPSPPQVSVFETDSDDEDEEDARGRSRGSEAKRLARRLMHGLVHHYHDHERRNKSPGAKHKRSVSDEVPNSSSKGRGGGSTGSTGSGTSGSSNSSSFSRAVHAARLRRARSVSASASRSAVSMDLPRERHPHQQQNQQQLNPRHQRHRQQALERLEGEGENRSRLGGDLFGRLLKRRGA